MSNLTNLEIQAIRKVISDEDIWATDLEEILNSQQNNNKGYNSNENLKTLHEIVKKLESEENK